jgi:hypothetical protein
MRLSTGRRMLRTLVAVVVIAGCVAVGATAAGDPLTGVWVAHDLAGDGSTDTYVFSGPNAAGKRSFTLIDSYGTFCETAGAGTGSVLIAQGTAYLEGDGKTVDTTFAKYVCGNGKHGVFNPPLVLAPSQLTPTGLNVGGYYTAVRVGT